MPWPMSQDYNEAIQDPARCFADPELQAGEVVCNTLGLPAPCSGNFADVYAVVSGQRKFAVKCFTRQIPGLRERYLEISKFLAANPLPFMVEFTFLDQGVRVGAAWYPILKMHWVEGVNLNTFTRDHADKPQILGNLCTIWVKLAAKLRETQLAHGDLQHGNVLLVPGQKGGVLSVRLVDYDGMFVPALEMLKTIEVGHPSFQHPQRQRDGIYSIDVDRFSHLVIYTALRAIIVGGQALWQKYDNGDNLLFKQADFLAPTKSPLFAELLRSPDGDVKKLAAALATACTKPLDQTPHLSDLVEPIPAPAPAASGVRPRTKVVVPKTAPVSAENIFARATGASGTRLARKPAGNGGKLAIIGAVALTLLLAVGGVGAWLVMKGGATAPTQIVASNPARQVTPPPPTRPETKIEPKIEPSPVVEPKVDPPKVEPPPAEPKVASKVDPKVDPKADPKNDKPLPPSPVASVLFARLGTFNNWANVDDRVRAAVVKNPKADCAEIGNPADRTFAVVFRAGNRLYLRLSTGTGQMAPLTVPSVELKDSDPSPAEVYFVYWGALNNWSDLSETARQLHRRGNKLSPSEFGNLADPAPGTPKSWVLVYRIGKELVFHAHSTFPEIPALKTENPVTMTPLMTAKEAVPDAGKQAASEKLVREVFKSDFAKKTAKEQAALADKLLQRGAETRDDPAARFVLLRLARDIATAVGDVALAFKAIESLAAQYQVNELELKTAALEQAARAPSTLKSLEALMTSALATLDAAIVAEDFTAASSLLKTAESAAVRLRSLPAQAAIRTRTKDVEVLKAETARAKVALAALQKTPADPEVNLTAGRYLCFVKGDWGQGLPLLVKGSAVNLKDLATKDLGGLKDPIEQMALGDGWHGLVETEASLMKKQLQRRAAHWYKQALPGLTGPSQTKVEQRLKAMSASLDALTKESIPKEEVFPWQPKNLVGVIGEHQQGSKNKFELLSFSPNGEYLALAQDKDLVIWDVGDAGASRRLVGHAAVITCAAYSSDGKLLATGSEDGVVKLWEASNGKSRGETGKHTGAIRSIAFMPQSEALLVSTGTYFALKKDDLGLWDTTSGRELWKREFVNAGAVTAAATPDGSNVAVVFSGGNPVIGSGMMLDAKTGATVFNYPNHRMHWLGVACSPDGSLIAPLGIPGYGDPAKNPFVWSSRKGDVLRQLADAPIKYPLKGNNCTFSPDGKKLAYAIADSVVVWNPLTGAKISEWSHPKSSISICRFAPDSRHLAIGNSDGAIYILRMN